LTGPEAKDKFWTLYKSERKFKDTSMEDSEVRDPRFAYMQTCCDLKVMPRAGSLIKDKESPIIDFSNQYIGSSGGVKSVAAAVERYNYPVKEITFCNNGFK
jgi:hypothetical protein